MSGTNLKEATVITLEATVNVLMIGKTKITRAQASERDVVKENELEFLGRIRDEKNGDYIIGSSLRDVDRGTLVRTKPIRVWPIGCSSEYYCKGWLVGVTTCHERDPYSQQLTKLTVDIGSVCVTFRDCQIKYSCTKKPYPLGDFYDHKLCHKSGYIVSGHVHEQIASLQRELKIESEGCREKIFKARAMPLLMLGGLR